MAPLCANPDSPGAACLHYSVDDSANTHWDRSIDQGTKVSNSCPVTCRACLLPRLSVNAAYRATVHIRDSLLLPGFGRHYTLVSGEIDLPGFFETNRQISLIAKPAKTNNKACIGKPYRISVCMVEPTTR